MTKKKSNGSGPLRAPQSKKKNGKGLSRAPLSNSARSRQSGRNAARYRESERILSVAGNTTFGVVGNVACNPGLSDSFPWLSGHAQLYERYKIHKLVYHYKSLKAATTNGQVLLSFDYDTLDSAPTTAVEVAQSTVYESDRVWECFSLHIPVDPNRVLFTRSGSIGSADAKTYDFGRMYVSAEGCDDTSNQGFIEVEYDIECFDKQTGSSPSLGAGDFAVWNLSANQSASNTTVTIAFDEEPITNPLTLANSSGTFTIPQAGLYEISCDLSTTVGLGATPATLEVDDAAATPPILFSGSVANGASASLAACIISLTAGQTIRIRGSGASSNNFLGDGCRIMVKYLASTV